MREYFKFNYPMHGARPEIKSLWTVGTLGQTNLMLGWFLVILTKKHIYIQNKYINVRLILLYLMHLNAKKPCLVFSKL